MTRANLILLGVLLAVVGLWLASRDWSSKEGPTVTPRLFPEFNREAADGIEISGGWQGSTFLFHRTGSEWTLEPGGFPVKKEQADKFLDAIFNLRRDNELGTTADLQERTHTDAKNGRLVRVFRGDKPIAEFRVGKNPKQAYEQFFVRKEGDDRVFRTLTLLSADREKAPDPSNPTGGANAFDWHNYVNNLSTRWVDTAIWDLKNAEPVELWLTRPDGTDLKLVKKAEDKWELTVPGEEPVAADADACAGIVDQVRRLNLYEVLGPDEEARREYGLEAPAATLVMKLRRKVEKKEEPAREGEEKKEGEEKAPAEEYETLDRILEVGRKVERQRYDSYDDEFASDDYYAIRVGPANGLDDATEKRNSRFDFLVNSYKVAPLLKSADDFRAKTPEKPEGEGEEHEGTVTPPDEHAPGEGPKDEGTKDEGKDTGGEGCTPGDEGCGCGAGDEGCSDDEGCGTGDEGCGTGDEGCGTGDEGCSDDTGDDGCGCGD